MKIVATTAVCLLVASVSRGALKDEKRKPLRLSEWSKQSEAPSACRPLKDACRRAGHFDIDRHGENRQKQCVRDLLDEKPVYKVNASARDIEACRKSKEK
jgi:hypothetical protein